MSYPTVTIASPLDSIGVRLLPFESSEFQAVLSSDRDKTLDSPLRYSAMLKNDTGKSILAYTILWILRDAKGDIQTSEDAWFNFSAFPPPRHLPAHRSKFVTPFGEDTFDRPSINSSNIPASTKQVFDQQKAINIVLSAVLFDDGMAAGPDTRGWISRWQAYLSAERDVFTAAINSRPGELGVVMNKLVRDASILAKPLLGHTEKIDLGYGELFEAFRLGDVFEKQYTFYAGVAAASVLRRLQDSDEVTIRDQAHKVLISKNYPRVQKLGEL